MGKRIISQRRGRGKSSLYKASSHRYKARVKYLPLTDKPIKAKVEDIGHCPGHNAPLILIRYEDGRRDYLFATEGICVGDEITIGENATIKNGNILPLSKIPEGTLVHNVEALPGDGGKFVRSSGVFARVANKTENKVTLIMPSKKKKEFDIKCRAGIGVVAGGGRKEKPFVKAGKRYYAMKARGRLYPITSKVAMNANDHPFGSGRGRHAGRPTVAPKNAPPGQKVGKIRARRTGKKK